MIGSYPVDWLLSIVQATLSVPFSAKCCPLPHFFFSLCSGFRGARIHGASEPIFGNGDNPNHYTGQVPQKSDVYGACHVDCWIDRLHDDQRPSATTLHCFFISQQGEGFFLFYYSTFHTGGPHKSDPVYILT